MNHRLLFHLHWENRREIENTCQLPPKYLILSDEGTASLKSYDKRLSVRMAWFYFIKKTTSGLPIQGFISQHTRQRAAIFTTFAVGQETFDYILCRTNDTRMELCRINFMHYLHRGTIEQYIRDELSGAAVCLTDKKLSSRPHLRILAFLILQRLQPHTYNSLIS